MRRWIYCLLVAALVAGCGDDDPTSGRDEGEEEQEQEVNQVVFMRLVIGSTTIVINRTSTVIGNPVIFGPPDAVITATFLDANSQPLVISATDFRMDVTPDASGRFTFTRTGPFTGTFVRLGAGTASFTVALHHISKNHNDHGPHTVPVTVQ